MPRQHFVTTFDPTLVATAAPLGRSRRPTGCLVHLLDMDTNLSRQATDTDPHHDSLEPVLTLSELAVRLCVSVQTLYDLRSQGRGPHGFRVGRHLRFRASEIDAWLARLEEADSERQRVPRLCRDSGVTRQLSHMSRTPGTLDSTKHAVPGPSRRPYTGGRRRNSPRFDAASPQDPPRRETVSRRSRGLRRPWSCWRSGSRCRSR